MAPWQDCGRAESQMGLGNKLDITYPRPYHWSQIINGPGSTTQLLFSAPTTRGATEPFGPNRDIYPASSADANEADGQPPFGECRLWEKEPPVPELVRAAQSGLWCKNPGALAGVRHVSILKIPRNRLVDEGRYDCHLFDSFMYIIIIILAAQCDLLYTHLRRYFTTGIPALDTYFLAWIGYPDRYIIPCHQDGLAGLGQTGVTTTLPSHECLTHPVKSKCLSLAN